MLIRRAICILLFAVLAAGLSPVTRAAADDEPSGDDLATQCRENGFEAVPEIGPRTCKNLESGPRLAAQYCRRVPGLDPQVCASLDGRDVSEQAMKAFERSWLARALDFQRDLDRGVPMTKSLIAHTHNSANSAAYAPSLANTDPNQVLTLTDQLRLGIRGIEIDIHWVPSPTHSDAEHGFMAVVQCHGEPVDLTVTTVHAGCTVDTPLETYLLELRRFLTKSKNRDEMVLLYLENALDDDKTAHNTAAQAIHDTIGDLVYRPSGRGCSKLPVDISRAAVLAKHKQIMITGNCGPGAWTSWVYERGPRWNESGSVNRYGAKGCKKERRDEGYGTKFIRRYEDSTWLSKMAGSGSELSSWTTRWMVHCGVNLLGFDQLYAGDPRLAELVWSWAPYEPSGSPDLGCALQRAADAHFVAARCSLKYQAACRTTSGGWVVTKPVEWKHAAAACAERGARFATPVNGYDNDQLALKAGYVPGGKLLASRPTWVNYVRSSPGHWTPGLGTAGASSSAPSASTASATSQEGSTSGVTPVTAPRTPLDPASSSSSLPGYAMAVTLLVLLGVAAYGQIRHVRRSRQPDDVLPELFSRSSVGSGRS